MHYEAVKSGHSVPAPLKAQAKDEMQEAIHGNLHSISKISPDEDHMKPGRADV